MQQRATLLHIPSAPFMQAERQELGLQVVPVLLVPGDILGPQELRAAQQRMRSPELNQATACTVSLTKSATNKAAPHGLYGMHSLCLWKEKLSYL